MFCFQVLKGGWSMILAMTPHHTFATERSTVQPAIFETICTAITTLLTDHISRSLGSWQKSLNSVFHDCLTALGSWVTRNRELLHRALAAGPDAGGM